MLIFMNIFLFTMFLKTQMWYKLIFKIKMFVIIDWLCTHLYLYFNSSKLYFHVT